MEQTTQFIKEIRKPEHPNYKKMCVFCGREFESVRIDAKYCTPLCRVKHKKGLMPPDYIKNVEKMRAEAAVSAADRERIPAHTFKNFDFEACMSCQPEDTQWTQFKDYLKAEFGWKKGDMMSFKAVKNLCDAWNKQHKENKITLKRSQAARKDGCPMTRIVFFVS